MQNGDDAEFQKMVSGALYNSTESSLSSMRAKAKQLCREFNLDIGYHGNFEQRHRHLSSIFGAFGQGSVVEPPIRVDYGFNIEIGRNFYSNFDLVILDCAKVTIGDNVLIGPGAHIYTATHPQDVETRHVLNLEMARPVVIEKNVWLGGKAVVLPGIKIGEGSVIGAGSVVTKDIPSFSMAVGNPAKVIKKLK